METKNLTLVGYAPKHILALIEGEESFARTFGFPSARGLREFYTSGAVSPQWLAKLQSATEADPWTHGFALVHNASRKVIGGAGFKGPPDSEGIVEIAYGVVPDHQNKGYATEAAEALVSYAAKSGRVRTLRAHTLAQVNASTRVLTKCGFRRVGEVMDPEDGLVWRWEKCKEPQRES